MKIHFLILAAFKFTGGIEKFNKCLMHALNTTNICKELQIFSVYDIVPDERYIPKSKFKGYNGKKINFILNTLMNVFKMKIIIVGHINLAPIILLLKVINPKLKIILIGHGIDIWGKQKYLKKKLLVLSDQIWVVSNFTKNTMEKNNSISKEKVKILHNTVDPFFKIPTVFNKPDYLMKRYGLTDKNKIILTVTRINATEKYKGYDTVIDLLPEIIKDLPNIVYVLCGKYDQKEKLRLEKKVLEKELTQNFILTGYIPEIELADHYLLGDVFILPSIKEGFGIVFIEALACRLYVIGGNMDGTVDALGNGKFGNLVNPTNKSEVLGALFKGLIQSDKNESNGSLQYFGFEKYQNTVKTLLQHFLN